jgi:hypothetical protein
MKGACDGEERNDEQKVLVGYEGGWHNTLDVPSLQLLKLLVKEATLYI